MLRKMAWRTSVATAVYNFQRAQPTSHPWAELNGRRQFQLFAPGSDHFLLQIGMASSVRPWTTSRVSFQNMGMCTSPNFPGNNASSVIVRGSPATTAGGRQAAVHIDDAMPRIRKAFSFCRVVPWRWHILELRKNQFRHWYRVIATGNRYSNSCAGAFMLSM